MGKRLYVGNLPFDTDEAALRAAFGQDGRQVLNVHLVMDRETGRPRGFAFVEMNSDEDAKKAIVAMDGAEFSGRRLRVNEAEDRRPMGRGPGGPGGPPRGPGGPGAARPGGGFGAPRPSYGGGGPAAGGGDARNFGPPALPASVEDKKKYAEKKNPKRRHDEDENYGGRRGSRRFDDDDES